MDRLKDFLTRLHLPNWICIVLLAAFILRVPSFFEPYSYGDETIYLTLGQGLREGLTFYKDIHDNKPPLLYLLAGISGSLFWFKAILAFWSLATIVLFWKLAKALFPKEEKLQKVSTLIFSLLITLPLLEGNIANAENFMIGPIILAFYLLFTGPRNFRNIFSSGVLLGIATLFKVPAAFDLAAIFGFWVINLVLGKEKVNDVLKNSGYLLLGLATPAALTFVWYSAAGTAYDYWAAAFLQNVGYLSSFRPGDVIKPFWVRNLPLIIRAGVGGVGFMILLAARKKLSNQFIFVTLWLLTSLFAVTLSERPYPHYLLQAAGPISFLLGILFSLRSLEQSLAIIPLTLAFFVPFYFRFWYYSTASYYLRFWEFATGRTSRETYLSNFGKYVPRNYEIANFLANFAHPKDRVFIWGPDSSNIYALARVLPPIKYVADYHINDFTNKSEIIKVMEQRKPKYIVILPEAQNFPGLSTFLGNYYLLTPLVDSAQVWKLK